MRRRVAAVVVAGVLVAAGCGGDDAADGAADVDSPDPTTTEAAPSTTTASAADPPEVGDADPASDCVAPEVGSSEFVLDAGGAEHDVRVYVPTEVDGTATVPLVMNFHGFAVNGDVQATVTGYEEFAEDNGFVVVHPTAVPPNGSDRNSWELADLDAPGKDDLAFTNELLDLLIEDYCVDESRVYATGLSGGGMFTSRLVCDMADRIAAASAVAALEYSDTCDPARAVPFMAIHGTEDRVVPFDGDLTGTAFENESFAQPLLSEPIPDEFAELAVAMGCDPVGDRVEQSTDIFATTYAGCDDDVPVVFYEVVNGGHTWPSTPLADTLTDFQGYITFEIDATSDSWAFFEPHSLDL